MWGSNSSHAHAGRQISRAAKHGQRSPSSAQGISLVCRQEQKGPFNGGLLLLLTTMASTFKMALSSSLSVIFHSNYHSEECASSGTVHAMASILRCTNLVD
ncbi:hypothetical protein QQF64_007961 [Cirrhinus molitorella]|uniref:Uncharacterized protein n=1 Tax=Cirrhinus molitorella TaxID=172907 RepID=A0ABR3M4S5_9TELE